MYPSVKSDSSLGDLAANNLTAAATMAFILLGRHYQLTLPTGAVIGSTVAVLVMGVDFGLVAMIIGVLSGSRGLALGLTSALAAASYLVSSLAPVLTWAHTVRPASLFYWAVGGDQLTAPGPRSRPGLSWCSSGSPCTSWRSR